MKEKSKDSEASKQIAEILKRKTLSGGDIALLDMVADDLKRIKALKKEVWQHGVILKEPITDKQGNLLGHKMVSNPAVELLHRAETQLRTNLRELSMTSKERRRSSQKNDDPLGDVIDL